MSIHRAKKDSSMKFVPMRREEVPANETDYMYRKFGTNVNGQGDRPDRDPIFRAVTANKSSGDDAPRKPNTKSFKAKNSK